jgi:hypothetical protein
MHEMARLDCSGANEPVDSTKIPLDLSERRHDCVAIADIQRFNRDVLVLRRDRLQRCPIDVANDDLCSGFSGGNS